MVIDFGRREGLGDDSRAIAIKPHSGKESSRLWLSEPVTANAEVTAKTAKQGLLPDGPRLARNLCMRSMRFK